MPRKSIAKNSFYNLLYKGFTALFLLLTTSYISRVLLPDGVGIVAYANTIVNYFVVVAALGIPNYGVKVIASKRQNLEGRSKSFAELLVINAISTLIFLLLYYCLVNFSSIFHGKIVLMNTMGIMLVLNFFNIDWFYQGLEEYGYISTRSIIVKIISFVLMCIFVKTKEDYIIYAFILCLATAGNYFFNIFNARKYITTVNFKNMHLKKHLRPVLILLAVSIATEVYTMLDTVMLEFFKGDAAVGYYTNSVKIVRMIYTVNIAMVATFYPRISSLFAEKKLEEANKLLTIGTSVLLLIAIPSVIGMFGVAEYIVPVLLGKAFMPSIEILQILSILVFVFSIAYFLGHLILMASGNEGHILKATVCGALVNAVMNLCLIPKYSANGAAIASVAAEMIVTIVMLLYSHQYFKLNIDRNFVKSLVISNAAMLATVVIMKKILTDIYLGLIVLVVVAVTVYGATLILTKNQVVIEILNHVRRWKNASN